MEYADNALFLAGRNRAKFWGGLFLMLIFVIVVPTIWKSLSQQIQDGGMPDLANTLMRAATLTSSFMITVPIIIRLGLAYPFTEGRLWKAVGVHVLGILLFIPLLVFVDLLLRTFLGIFVEGYRLKIEAISFIFLNNISYFHALAPFVYCLTLGVVNLDLYYRKYRQTSEISADLEARLVQARLQLLKMQLHPHFLFNTLNAIVTLIHRDRDVARAMISNLSELLTYSTQTRNTPMTTVREEISFIRRYLDIEKVRFGDHLEITYDLDPHLLYCTIPSLLLQPIVENAVKHGTARKVGTGLIHLQVSRKQSMLCIQVSDNGPGLKAGGGTPSGTGIGLRNTRERLAHMYQGRAELHIENQDAGGVLVTILIPHNFHDHDN